jgi:hypothetical protein
LAGPGHICLQDNKSPHILRCAHLRCRSIPWNRRCQSSDQIARQRDNQGGTPAPAITGSEHLPRHGNQFRQVYHLG